MKTLISVEYVEERICFIRGQKVMLDEDLAKLYGVSTSRLNERVKRNKSRFPQDFLFQLSREEEISLRSHSAILKNLGRGQHRKYPPHAFTEQGVAMLSSILQSEQAVLVNIAIMRAFVKLRKTLALSKELAAKLEELERKVVGHDAQIQSIFDAIRRLMSGPEKPIPRIGFRTSGKDDA